MRYFLLLFSFLLSGIGFATVFAGEDISIVSREQWGADESLRYADSPEWKNMYASYLQYLQSPKTQDQLDALQLEDDRISFIEKTFGLAGQIVSRQYSENGHPLVAPIEKVKQVSRIIIHHEGMTLDKDETDEEMIRRIYRSHTLSKQWGDIAYHYIIGQRGKIYEGRAGGDYTVGVHALYNNRGTVGIMVLGDYSKNNLNSDQIAGIKKLIPFLAKKYGITLSNSTDGVECTNYACKTLKKVTTRSLIGHRDVRATDCPGENMYPLISEWMRELDVRYSPVLNSGSNTIEPVPLNQVMNRTLRVTQVIPPKISLPVTIKPVRYAGPKFRVKLSYPDSKNIVLATADGMPGKLFLDKKKIVMSASQKVEINILGDKKLSLKVGSKTYSGSEIKLSHSVVRIDSWDRVPEWDKAGKYNDNLFRDTIRIVNGGSKLTVINDLPLEWYLKGLGEVSNTDLGEKIKVIIVAARSYARYYMDPKNRKFSTNLYDGSDNPDEFQKYLGYSYELRSPNVAKLVDATRSQVILHSGSIVKAWYHSSSDGQTRSYLEYCRANGGVSCVDIPYLQSVSDPGSVGKNRSGHGVGISGIGATYWAGQGWNYKTIIGYYLKGVEIGRK